MSDAKFDVAKIRALTRAYKYQVDYAIKSIKRAAVECDSWYVAFSGGKDSTCVLDLVNSIMPNCGILYVDEEWLLPETEEYLQRQAERFGSRFHRIRKRDQHAEFFTAWENDDEVWTGKNVTGRYAEMHGWQGAFLGLREEESGKRRVHLRTGGRLFFNQGRQIWQCNPIAGWTWQDVWAYIYSRGLDYNHAYDRLDEIGVEPERQRIGPLANRFVLGYGQLVILKRGWPDLFNEFAARHPEARAYG